MYLFVARARQNVGLPGGPNDVQSWTWVGKCANPMRIAVNRGFGRITGKPANAQLRVIESQIRIRGAGRTVA